MKVISRVKRIITELPSVESGLSQYNKKKVSECYIGTVSIGTEFLNRTSDFLSTGLLFEFLYTVGQTETGGRRVSGYFGTN